MGVYFITGRSSRCSLNRGLIPAHAKSLLLLTPAQATRKCRMRGVLGRSKGKAPRPPLIGSRDQWVKAPRQRRLILLLLLRLRLSFLLFLSFLSFLDLRAFEEDREDLELFELRELRELCDPDRVPAAPGFPLGEFRLGAEPFLSLAQGLSAADTSAAVAG